MARKLNYKNIWSIEYFIIAFSKRIECFVIGCRAGPPTLVRILVKFSLGEMGGLLVKSKNLGEIKNILVK